MPGPDSKPGFDPALHIVLDARSLRGLAHPLRVRLLGELRERGAATATQLASRVGESSGATSYHLRQLAAYGFVVEDEGRGTARERWWAWQGCWPRWAPRAWAPACHSPVLTVVLIGGLGAGGINPIPGAVEYERVPRHLQVRVLGAVGAAAWAGIPLGGLAGGAMVTTFGLHAALLAAAATYGVTTLAPFVFPAWRQMERRPRPAEQRQRTGDNSLERTAG